jgi:hypothetical protein
LEQLRDQFYALANATIAEFKRSARSNSEVKTGAGEAVVYPIKYSLRLVPESDHNEILERASIMEFDGHLTQEEADRAAFSHYLTEAKRVV